MSQGTLGPSYLDLNKTFRNLLIFSKPNPHFSLSETRRLSIQDEKSFTLIIPCYFLTRSGFHSFNNFQQNFPLLQHIHWENSDTFYVKQQKTSDAEKYRLHSLRLEQLKRCQEQEEEVGRKVTTKRLKILKGF